MKEFLINEKTIKLPETWEDVSWGTFLGFDAIVQAHSKETKERKGTEEGEWKTAIRNLDLNTKILSYWAGLTEEEISHWDMSEAEKLMECLAFVNREYIPIDIKSFKVGDEKFFLPENLMGKSSFGRYIEAEQLEIQSSMIDKGKIEVMPRQIAVLCKKEGESEKLNDDLIDSRAKLFEQLDMATIWDVAFFLTKLEQSLMISFLTSQQVETQRRQEQQKEQ